MRKVLDGGGRHVELAVVELDNQVAQDGDLVFNVRRGVLQPLKAVLERFHRLLAHGGRETASGGACLDQHGTPSAVLERERLSRISAHHGTTGASVCAARAGFRLGLVVVGVVHGGVDLRLGSVGGKGRGTWRGRGLDLEVDTLASSLSKLVGHEGALTLLEPQCGVGGSAFFALLGAHVGPLLLVLALDLVKNAAFLLLAGRRDGGWIEAIELSAGEIVELFDAALTEAGAETADDGARDGLDGALYEVSAVLDNLAALLAELVGAEGTAYERKVADAL